jgi:hypothetical protein
MEILKNLNQMSKRLEEIVYYFYMDNDELSSVLKIPVHMENFKEKSHFMLNSIEINHLIQIYKYIEEHKDFLLNYTFNQEFTLIEDLGNEMENDYPDKSSLVYQSFLRYKESFETWYFSILRE